MNNITVGQKWHAQSQALGPIEGVAVGFAITIGFIVFILVGSAAAHAKMAVAQPAADEIVFEAVDIPIKEVTVQPPFLGLRNFNPNYMDRAVQQEPEQEAVEEYYYYDDTAYYGYSGGNDYGNPFKSDGIRDEGGRHYTWYSQNVLPGEGLTELNENGRHVDESTGYVVDGDGYIALAVPEWEMKTEDNPDGYSVGDVVETPFGDAKVYDTNEGGSYDVYTDF